jgi:hypothetical protein
MGWQDDPVVKPPPAWMSDEVVADGVAPNIPQVGWLETLGSSYADAATLGFGDELGAGMQSVMAALTPGMNARETYRQARDENRERLTAGRDQNKWAGRVGTGLGIGAGMLVPGGAAAKGVGGLAKIGHAAAAAAPLGLAYGVGASDADLLEGDWRGVASDAENGLALGTLVGGVAKAAEPYVAKGVGWAAGKLSDATEALAVKSGRRTIQGSSDIAAATRKPLSDEAVKEALRAKTIIAGGTTQGAYKRIGERSAEEGKILGQILDALEANGVRGPVARELADQLFEKYGEKFYNTGSNKAAPNRFLDEAINIEAIAQGNERLGLRQTEAVKRDLQRAAKFERLQNSATEDATQEASAIVRDANERAITAAGKEAGAGSEVAGLAERFVPSKQKLGNLLEVRAAAERGAAKAQGRQQIGIKDAVLGAATGEPLSAMGVAMVSSMARNRIPSTIAASSYGSHRAFDGIKNMLATNPQKLTFAVGPAATRALVQASQKGEQSLAVAHHVLASMPGKQGEDYRAGLDELAKSE